MRRHCDAVGRDIREIEVTALLAAPDDWSPDDVLREAAQAITTSPESPGQSGNGLGSAAISGAIGGAMGALQFLLPLAAKAFMPLPF